MSSSHSLPSPRPDLAPFEAEVRAGLAGRSPRRLPAALLYDAAGSRLFEEITALPEYYPTRLERRLLGKLAPELAGQCAPPGRVVELGSGSAAKTRCLLAELCKRFLAPSYVANDISQVALQLAASSLRTALPDLQVNLLVGTFESALAALDPRPAPLVLLLGGIIGNFSPSDLEDLVKALGRALPAQSQVLVGYDRPPHARKPMSAIEAAYNDTRGVTARFNRNVLRRLNRDLGADFEVRCWRHEARWVAAEQQIEMRLVAECSQQVQVPALGLKLAFDAGECLITEISRRFGELDLEAAFGRGGFERAGQWQDPRGWFGLMLLRKVCAVSP